MNSDQIVKWTAIFTNIAIVIGLVFVGLEFRNNTKATIAERVDNLAAANAELTIMLMQEDGIAEIQYRAHRDPDSLTVTERERYEGSLNWYQRNFVRIHHYYQQGFLSQEDWEFEKAAIGYVFVSPPGLEYIEIMSASNLAHPIWGHIMESAAEAKAYCDSPDNLCVPRLEPGGYDALSQ